MDEEKDRRKITRRLEKVHLPGASIKCQKQGQILCQKRDHSRMAATLTNKILKFIQLKAVLDQKIPALQV